MVSVTSLEGFDPMDIFNSKKEFKDWLLSHIDLTNLSPYMSDEKLKEFLDKANNYGFKRVCIPITAVKKSKEFLEGKDIKIITFISSFHGNRNNLDEKIKACSDAISEGADEIEFSSNLSLIGEKTAFEEEAASIVNAVKEGKKVSKLYLEIDYLPDDLVNQVIMSAQNSHPDYISIAINLKEDESYDGENLNIAKERFEKIDSVIKDRKDINLKIYSNINSFNDILPILYLSTKYKWDIQSFRVGTEFGFDIIDGMDVSDF
ncbi:MAG: Deoxyribose-phosphate aldolase-like protein [Candidatus Parvarchaeum acidophilus ARMAN-5]|jgi:deoxyribose-phosphate aldolase|uniref:Deoxyribose-phosphate aldolase-like protein n=1 Tax=Candidatus Parvarchaeum acidophilus ARMAN-5 TaxID=662762 RepID=D6GV78_PARA5|nr:MAG: Deoxyribose-phosphate aldolase-like protein [Candidatus Parvarchaeum acidophilus ARMAN-5]